LPKPASHRITHVLLRQTRVPRGIAPPHSASSQQLAGGWATQRPRQFRGRAGGQTQRPVRQIRPVTPGRQLAVVQQRFLGMHCFRQRFLPFGQGAASASAKPSNPAREPSRAPPSVRRVVEDATSRVKRSNDEESMATSRADGRRVE
jgi:hypothetical protein